LSHRLSREEEESSGELYYPVRSDVFFFLKAGYIQYRFNEIASAWRNSDSWQGYAGLQFPITGRLRGALTLGYKSFLPRDESQEPFSGLVGEADLDYRLRRIRFRAEYKRGNSFSYWSNTLYFIENQIGGGVSFYLTRFLRLDYDFSYGENRYPEAEWIISGAPAQIKRHDIYRTHTAGLTVRIYRSLGLSFNVNHWERRTNVFYGDRQGWFAGGSLVFDF
ncbi:MAG: outer membrane beta-barrel protein, partial [Candidatus Aminicenantes bacterium]